MPRILNKSEREIHTTGQERTQGIAPFLFAHTSVREKETTTHKERDDKTKSRSQGSQEDKPRTTKAKPQKIGEEDEKRKK